MTVTPMTYQDRENAQTTRSAEPPKDITHVLADFERSHDVTRYDAFGWKAWPFLRVGVGSGSIARRLELDNGHSHGLDTKKSDGLVENHTTDRRKRRLEPFLRLVANVADENCRASIARPRHADIAVLSDPLRAQRVADRWIQYVADPMKVALDEAGLRVTHWSSGARRVDGPPATEYCLHSIYFNFLMFRRRNRQLLRAPAPAWFPEYQDLCFHLGGPAPDWSTIRNHLLYVTSCAQMFERRLKRSRARALLIDGWTVWAHLGATLAARRLGLDVVDIQHGVQEYGHFSYHGWVREPAGGWDARPNVFWVWGETAAEYYRRENQTSTSVVVGGNLWLQQWLSGKVPGQRSEEAKARKAASGWDYAVLVTLSRPPERGLAHMEHAFRSTERRVVWFVRLHPAEVGALDQLKRKWPVLNLPNVDTQVANELPLYALLSVVRGHVSIGSTVCNEALAFGVPSVLINRLSFRVFEKHIADGVMAVELDPKNLVRSLDRMAQLPNARLIAASRQLFCSDEDAAPARQELFNRFKHIQT